MRDSSSLGPVLEAAFARLSLALDRLDATALRHTETDKTRAALEAELALMREDRYQLARSLESAKTRAEQLEEGLAEAEPALDAAIMVLEAESRNL